MEKLCSKCRVLKPVVEFHRFRSGRQAWCKHCRREHDAEDWGRTRIHRLRLRKKHPRKLVAWYRALKEGTPCSDCGGVFHHAAMQWDHLPGTAKRREVSNMVLTGFRRETILDEIAK